MTTEQLLKPRYKVIADYPNSKFEVEQILMGQYIAYADKYPAIFKPLEWWVEREPSELPEYLQRGKGFYKVDKYAIKHDCVYINEEIEELIYYAPATLSDYTAYINQTNQTPTL